MLLEGSHFANELKTRSPPTLRNHKTYCDESAWQENQGKDGDDVHRQRLLLCLDGDLVHSVCPVHHLVA